MNMSPRQCSVLEGSLDLIRQFFHASGDGLRRSYLDRSPELISLTSALSLYTQTTDSLIKTFIATQTSQGKYVVVVAYSSCISCCCCCFCRDTTL